MRTPRIAALVALPLAAAALLAACSSNEATTATSAIAAASSAAGALESAQAAGSGTAGTADMRALCDQMVADALSPDAATALAEQKGYVARVGTIDGQPQALTMDYREDRFTFEVKDGKVTACTYG